MSDVYLQGAVAKLLADPAIDGHSDRLVAPADVHVVFLPVSHVLLQLALPDVAAEAEVVIEPAGLHLQGEKVRDVLHDGVG